MIVKRIAIALLALPILGACSGADAASPAVTPVTAVAETTSTTKPIECYLTAAQLHDRQAQAGSQGLDALMAEIERQRSVSCP